MTLELTRQTGSGSRNKKPDKREAIVEAARGLFTTEGYETTTIADVARKAGVAVGTVYLYFKSKPELLEAVRGNWDSEFVQYLAELNLQGVPYHLRARPIVEACFRMCEEHEDMVQLMGLPAQMIGVHEYKTGTEGGQIYAAIKSILDEGIAAGVFREIDTGAGAIIGFGMVHNSLHQCFDVEGGKNQERYIDALTDTFNHWLLRPEFLKLLYPES
jgi:AcrR family transcriptional regulator